MVLAHSQRCNNPVTGQSSSVNPIRQFRLLKNPNVHVNLTHPPYHWLQNVIPTIPDAACPETDRPLLVLQQIPYERPRILSIRPSQPLTAPLQRLPLLYDIPPLPRDRRSPFEPRTLSVSPLSSPYYPTMTSSLNYYVAPLSR